MEDKNNQQVQSEQKQDRTENQSPYPLPHCPYQKCDGSGHISVNINNQPTKQVCDCYKEYVLQKNKEAEKLQAFRLEEKKRLEKQKQKEKIKQALHMIMSGKIKTETTEDDRNQGFRLPACPYKKCDGSGYLSTFVDGEEFSSRCDCYNDHVMKKKLKNANIQQDYWKADIQNLRKLDVSLLQPKPIQGPRKIDKRHKEQPPEKPDAFIERTYDEKNVKKGIHFFAEQYTQKTLEYLEETPRTKTRNLMLIGESGRQKTYLACSIGKEFLKQNKSVYFSTMQDLLNNVYDKKINLHKIVTETDLLIIDEIGNEYHTDSQWALKQMKEIIRLRKNRNLPIICTSNYYPNAWEELYDQPLVSTFNGSFFITLLASDIDFRVEQMGESYDDYGFLD